MGEPTFFLWHVGGAVGAVPGRTTALRWRSVGDPPIDPPKPRQDPAWARHSPLRMLPVVSDGVVNWGMYRWHRGADAIGAGVLRMMFLGALAQHLV